MRCKTLEVKKFFVFLFLILTFSHVLPLTSDALEFEDIVAGARTGAFGGCCSAHPASYDGLFVNPAGLAYMEAEAISAGLGHYYSEPVANYHLGYYRPIYTSIAMASAWQSSRSPTRHLDRFYLSWSQSAPSRLPFFGKQQLTWGSSLRILSSQKRENPTAAFENKLGLGFDAGLLLNLPETRTRLGAALIGLDSANLDLKGPFLSLGAAQQWGRYALLMDWRAREGLSTLFPAVEASLYGGLLHLRVGRGIRLGRLKTLAWGFGFNLLPLIVDFALQTPLEGLYRREGAAMISVGYAFGGPRFYQKFTGYAAQEVQNLSQEMDRLDAQNRRKRAEAAALQRDLEVLREEIRVLRSTIREEKGSSELRRAEEEFRKQEERKKTEEAIKPPSEQWPKYRKVQPGDTLRSIAAQAYGDPNLWELIYKANPDKIIRGLPKVSEVLKIPKP